MQNMQTVSLNTTKGALQPGCIAGIVHSKDEVNYTHSS